jgi:superfamily II DNA or RNA helicase
VPTIALQEQWARELRKGFDLRESQIGFVGGPHGQLSTEHGFVVAVINSARTGVPALAAGWRAEGRPTLLVVDECHWAATESNAEIFEADAIATLGLSATPERSDDGLSRVLIPRIGAIVYSYSLLAGLDDELLAPLRCINLYFDLDESGRRDIEPLEHAIRLIEDSLLQGDSAAAGLLGLERESRLRQLAKETGQASALVNLIRRRTEILEKAAGRRALLNEVIRSDLVRSSRCLFFHERIAEAQTTAEHLENAGIRTSVDSSKDSLELRRRELRAFRNGSTTALVAVRTLDEGIDVPDAKAAVIAAGSASARQRVQRIGRVVRKTGQTAVVISLLARSTAEESQVGLDDAFLVGHDRVRHHRWPVTSLAEAFNMSSESSYMPQTKRPHKL